MRTAVPRCLGPLLLVLLIAGQARAAAPAGDAPTVGARLDKSEGLVGDVFTLSVTAVGPRSTPTNLPTHLDLDPFEVQGSESEPEIEEKDLGDGRVSRTFRLKVAAYEAGDLSLPPVEVTYIGKDGKVESRKTEPVPVKIKSLLANEPDATLKEAAPPVPVFEEDLTLAYIAGGLVIAALGGLIALYIRRRLRLRAAYRPPPPPRPPHEVALEKLGILARAGFTGDLAAFYFQLSEILREYLGARFGFPALEMTTEELVGELERRAPRGMVLGEIAGWLAGGDLVKFARQLPSEPQARGALETAIRIVESTRGRADTPVPPESTEATAESAHV